MSRGPVRLRSEAQWSGAGGDGPIVDVAELADGETPRHFELSTTGTAGLRWGKVSCIWSLSSLPIPAGAKGMAITSNFDNAAVTGS